MKKIILSTSFYFFLTITALQADTASEVTKVLQETLSPAIKEAGIHADIALKQYKIVDNHIVDFDLESQIKEGSDKLNTIRVNLSYHHSSLGKKLPNLPSDFEKYEVLLKLEMTSKTTSPLLANSKEEFEKLLKEIMETNDLDFSKAEIKVSEWKVDENGNGEEFRFAIELPVEDDSETSNMFLFEISGSKNQTFIYVGFDIEEPLKKEEEIIDFIKKVEQRDPATLTLIKSYSQIFAGALKIGFIQAQEALERPANTESSESPTN